MRNLNLLKALTLTFVRPFFEYATIFWDGCSSADNEKVENVQLHAARIVKGLPIMAFTESLNFETGSKSLAKRRGENAKLMTMH